jgi:hypothetical protein
MIPFILAAAGGYLIGNAPKSTKFATGGITDETFVQRLGDRYPYGSDISIYGGIYHELELETENNKFTIYFDLEPDIKSYGYRGIRFTLKRIVGSFNWTFRYDEEELSKEDKQKLLDLGGVESKTKFAHVIQGTTELDITPDNTDWKIDNEELKFSPSGSFIISEMEIDFTKKEMKLK